MMIDMANRPTWTATAVVVVGGVVLGLLGARYVFVSSALSLIPWGIAAAAIGYVAPTRKQALLGAAMFGFALTASFMFFGYDGEDTLVSRILPFCAIALVGAACALLPAALGIVLRRRMRQPR